MDDVSERAPETRPARPTYGVPMSSTRKDTQSTILEEREARGLGRCSRGRMTEQGVRHAEDDGQEEDRLVRREQIDVAPPWVVEQEAARLMQARTLRAEAG